MLIIFLPPDHLAVYGGSRCNIITHPLFYEIKFGILLCVLHALVDLIPRAIVVAYWLAACSFAKAWKRRPWIWLKTMQYKTKPPTSTLAWTKIWPSMAATRCRCCRPAGQCRLAAGKRGCDDRYNDEQDETIPR